MGAEQIMGKREIMLELINIWFTYHFDEEDGIANIVIEKKGEKALIEVINFLKKELGGKE